MSIKPQYVAQILKGNKTVEVRKKFPKDYVGWVYIYCTKHKLSYSKYHYLNDNTIDEVFAKKFGLKKEILNGKVVGRFWCDKVEEIKNYPFEAPEHPRGYRIGYDTQSIEWYKLCDLSCLSEDELFNYLGRNNGYGIHISKLEVFDNLKELKEFRHWVAVWQYCGMDCPPYVDDELRSLYKAPQNWCYVWE